MDKALSDMTEYIDVLDYVWMGVPFNVPLFEVYAQVPNPVSHRLVRYQQQNLHILKLGQYDVPLFEPLGLELNEMPSYAVVLADYQGTSFRLLARPADHIEGVSKVHHKTLKIRSSFQTDK